MCGATCGDVRTGGDWLIKERTKATIDSLIFLCDLRNNVPNGRSKEVEMTDVEK